MDAPSTIPVHEPASTPPEREGAALREAARDAPPTQPRQGPTRLRILELVRDRPRTVCELARRIGINKSAIHRHLQRLVADRTLTRTSHGKWVYYRPAPGVATGSPSTTGPTGAAARRPPLRDDA